MRAKIIQKYDDSAKLNQDEPLDLKKELSEGETSSEDEKVLKTVGNFTQGTGEDIIFENVEMGEWRSTPLDNKDYIGTTALGPCIGIILFIKVINKITNSSEMSIALSHFDSSTSCQDAKFAAVEDFQIDAEKVIVDSLINLDAHLEDRGKKLLEIHDILLLGGTKDEITLGFSKGLDILIKNKADIKEKKVSNFIEKISLKKIGLYEASLTTVGEKQEIIDRMNAVCNVFSEIKNKENIIHAEYRVVLTIKNNYFDLPFAYYTINLNKKLIKEELYLDNIIESINKYRLLLNDLNYFADILDGVIKDFRKSTSYEFIDDNKSLHDILRLIDVSKKDAETSVLASGKSTVDSYNKLPESIAKSPFSFFLNSENTVSNDNFLEESEIRRPEKIAKTDQRKDDGNDKGNSLT